MQAHLLKKCIVLGGAVALAAFVSVFVLSDSAGASPLLTADKHCGAAVGSKIIWTAADPGAGMMTQYRFVVRYPNGKELITRDFDIYNFFDWVPLEEGKYQVSVIVRDEGGMRSATEAYRVISRVTDRDAVITETQHPLVALYSIPPARLIGKVRVQFRADGEEDWQSTPMKLCSQHKSVNFLVAGMRSETTYEMRHETVFGKHRTRSSIKLFTTGAVSPEVHVPDFVVRHGPESQASFSDGILVHALLFGSDVISDHPQLWLNAPVATDLEGNVVWYYEEAGLPQNAGSFLMYFPPSTSGTFLIPMSRPAGPFSPGPIRGQILREIDLAGNTVRETNVERINEQLAAINQDPIYYFHHDIRRLPNGHTLAMAGVEKILSDVQGEGPIDVVGDMILDLDENFQLVWAWSTFGHDDMLPVTRRALRDEVCTGSEATGNVCGPLRQGSLSGDPSDTKPVAHDWTHGNTLTYTPADGNIILSFRHQDWVIKVDYSDGKGTGRILWRLGKDGDFDIEQKLDAPDPYPWFSAQHQPMIYAQNELVIYDNSNVRRPADLPDNAPGPNSRGQVYLLDEENMIATLVTNADLGVYASFLGSAQKLANGNYHFLSGGIAGAAPSPIPGFPSGLSQSTETNPEGEIVYTLEASHDTTYRSFRMKSMYAPAGIPGDADGDSDVDAKDLAEIGFRLFSRAAGDGDPCDLDGDGWVTLDDLRQAKNQCTLPQCRVLRWEDPVIGY